jgi:hypothetical protein
VIGELGETQFERNHSSRTTVHIHLRAITIASN